MSSKLRVLRIKHLSVDLHVGVKRMPIVEYVLDFFNGLLLLDVSVSQAFQNFCLENFQFTRLLLLFNDYFALFSNLIVFGASLIIQSVN